MKRPLLTTAGSIAALFVVTTLGRAGDWPKMFDHPPAGANVIALVNGEGLRFGAAKLKQSKDAAQKAASADLLAELPDHLKRAAIATNIDFDTLGQVWETTTATFDKPIPQVKAIADMQGGYVDQISGKSVVWSPRNRYIVPQGIDKVTVHLPANRPAVARWLRSLGQPAQPLADYLKKASERAFDGAALVLAVDMADTISATQATAKLATLKSVATAGLNTEALAKLIGDLHGITFTVTVSDQFMGQLQLDFGSSPAMLSTAGQAMVLEACSRRGVLLPELNEWKPAVEGNSFTLSGPLDAISVINLLSFFTSSPSTDDATSQAPPSAGGNSASSASGGSTTASMADASKKYFTSVQRVLSECRNTKGLGPGERGMFNDRLSRKIDNLPLLNVDPALLDYGMNVAQLLRGAAVAIKSANVAAGGQKAVQGSSSSYVGYYYSGYSFNDNSAYNESLTRQAHAEGMQQHVSNMQQIDNQTAEIRRAMTQKYMIEF
jgi:hypothetical protein